MTEYRTFRCNEVRSKEPRVCVEGCMIDTGVPHVHYVGIVEYEFTDARWCKRHAEAINLRPRPREGASLADTLSSEGES